jgi:DNA-binding PadR family transcriptional regulator
MTVDPKDYLPLRPVELLLLVSLTEQDLHGYALAAEIEARSDGTVRLEPGNLYRVIKRLVDDKLVEPAGKRAASEAGEERRLYYRITPLGMRVAAAEVQRLRALLGSAAVRALAPRS